MSGDYVFLGDKRQGAVVGPYPKDSVKDYNHGVRWCREVIGMTAVFRVLAPTQETATVKLRNNLADGER
jgi:hypothetical protein